jgi:anti-sigma factor RsiW
VNAVLQAVVCERVRAQISLQLDDELSELERRMLAVHLDYCPECRAFEADISAFTEELRAAPLQELEHPIVVRRPRAGSLARLQVGVAAVVAVVALGAVGQFSESDPNRSSLRAPVRFETSSDAVRELQQIFADGRAFKHTQGQAIPI